MMNTLRLAVMVKDMHSKRRGVHSLKHQDSVGITSCLTFDWLAQQLFTLLILRA